MRNYNLKKNGGVLASRGGGREHVAKMSDRRGCCEHYVHDIEANAVPGNLGVPGILVGGAE
jgi:hypothetical protein